MTEKYNIKDNPHKGNQGITRAFRAAINSWNGFIYAYQEESAFRQELALAFILIPSAFFLPVGNIERLMMIGSVLLVLIVELLNSSVEAAIDRISFEVHDLSKRAVIASPCAGKSSALANVTTVGRIFSKLSFDICVTILNEYNKWKQQFKKRLSE